MSGAETAFIALVAMTLLGVVSIFGLGALELSGNALVHRSVTGSPRRWASARQVYQRRQQLRHILVPSVIAFAGSVVCNVGTTVLLADLDRGRSWWAGVLWLMGGVVLVVVALAAVIGAPAREPWDLVRSYEALLLHVREAAHDHSFQLIPELRGRLNELDHRRKGGSDRRGAHALESVPIPRSAVLIRPRLGFRAIHFGGGSLAPSPRDVVSWAVHFRRGVVAQVALVFLLLLGAAIVGVLSPSVLAFMIIVIACAFLLAASLFLLYLGLRSDLMWWARIEVENQIFREEADELITAMTRNLRRRRSASRTPPASRRADAARAAIPRTASRRP